MPKGIKKTTIPLKGSRKKIGRPRIKIKWDIVDKYLMAGCSGVQIAASMGICIDTLYDRCVLENKVSFSSYSLEKYEKGNASLFAKQFSVAMEGDKTMLVWLGKQRLKQKDKIHQDIESKQQISQLAIMELPDNGHRFITGES